MNKKDIKNLLHSMRTSDNDRHITVLLGKIDLIDDEKLQEMVSKIGDTQDTIKSYLQEKLKNMQRRTTEEHSEHTPINDLFTFGTTGNSVHLHMPIQFKEIMKRKDVRGLASVIDLVNLYMLDAIQRISAMQKSGDPRLKNSDCIYMISPILISRELKFLETLDFETHSFSKKDLKNPKFISENPEAQLAVHIFGNENNVGTAKIGLDIVKTKEWQKKKEQKVKEYKLKGQTLSEKAESR